MSIPVDYQPAPDLLAERVILVTGAGDGIGRTAAETFATYGATVVLLGRTVAKLEAVYDTIVAANHPQPAIYPMDLLGAQPEHYHELAERIRIELGRLDGLLHNAAILGLLTPLERYPVDDWTRVMQVNVHAPFLLTQACLPILRAAPDAAIVFSASEVGRKGHAYWGAYGVSKFALEGMMQILADELDNCPGLRVNSLNPGPIRTAMRATAFPAEDPRTLPTPAEIMPAYLYLMGPDSRTLSGRALDAQ